MDRVRARCDEIRQAILDRLHGMEEGAPTRDVEYLQGLREAVARGVDYGICLLAGEDDHGSQLPVALITQARLSARHGIPLEIVIRRYLAGKTLLCDFMLAESATIGLQDPALLREALVAQETAFDRLLSLVTDEYRQEEQRRSASREAQLADRIRNLLAGEPVDPSPLQYDLDTDHLGVVAGSAQARQFIRKLASQTNSRCLLISGTREEVWAWLSSREPLDLEAIRAAASVGSSSTPIGLGEPGSSIAGWRLTHRQARAAFSVAQASPEGFARYADVSIIASAAQDPVMTASLKELYLSPLTQERDEGEMLRKTLRAYFMANRNSSSAASALRVSRQTVSSRLRRVEDRIGQPLSMCASAVDAGLRLEELGLLSS